MTSCNALVYEAIQRIYRNAGVEKIRSRMQAAFPDDFEIRITSRFSSWNDIVHAAARSTVTGVVTHPHEDVFDYLDVSHFPALLDTYFTVLAPTGGLALEQVSQRKRQVLSCAREIKEIRDPLVDDGLHGACVTYALGRRLLRPGIAGVAAGRAYGSVALTPGRSAKRAFASKVRRARSVCTA
jgi:hypothetical protein